MHHYDGYFGAAIFLMVLQWFAALGRCAIRVFIVRKFGKDDVAMLATLLVSSAYLACFLAIQVLTDGGKPDFMIDIDNLLQALNTILALLVLYIVGTLLLKVALGLLLLRVLVKRWQRLIIYALMALSVSYGIFYFFFVLFQCGNPSKFKTRIIFGQCLSTKAIHGTGYVHGTIAAVSDCILAALPIALIRKTDMSKRSKVSVTAILGLGSVGCICTFVRLGYVHDLSNKTMTFFETAKPLGILSGSELSIGVTCLSLSCYKPLFHRFFGNRTLYYYEDGSWHPRQQSHEMIRRSGHLQSVESNEESIEKPARVWSNRLPKRPVEQKHCASYSPHVRSIKGDETSPAESRALSPISPVSPLQNPLRGSLR